MRGSGMLKRLGDEKIARGIPIGDAKFPMPFGSGLEYAAPARGCWNIVHTGMLGPEAQEIFICGASCLRGVVLTAAEMGAAHRFSTVEVREENLLNGDMEDLIIEGVTDILNRLPKMPPVVLVYTSCVHHFTGCDLDLVYARLRERFPDVDFADCYMNPIMRKSGLTPDQLIRKGMLDLLKPCPINDRAVMLLNFDQPTMASSDLMVWLKEKGFTIHENAACDTYEEYQQMAESAHYISYNPAANAGAQQLEKRLGGKLTYLPFSFKYEEIDNGFRILAQNLGVEPPVSKREECDAALRKALDVIGQMPIVIDYTCCSRPLSLARLLLDHGFRVERVYVDAITGEEKGDFAYLQENYPQLELWPTIHPNMRFSNHQEHGGYLAIGQKAAYFTNSNHFVNLVSGGGMVGYQAILHLTELMMDAYHHEKDMRSLIQIKGKGCEVCR